MLDQNNISRFAGLLRLAADEGVAASSPPEVVSLSLMSVNPDRWQNGVELPIPANCLIFPKGLGFDSQDVGKTFLFLQLRKGKNGKQYVFWGEKGVTRHASDT